MWPDKGGFSKGLQNFACAFLGMLTLRHVGQQFLLDYMGDECITYLNYNKESLLNIEKGLTNKMHDFTNKKHLCPLLLLSQWLPTPLPLDLPCTATTSRIHRAAVLALWSEHAGSYREERKCCLS